MHDTWCESLLVFTVYCSVSDTYRVIKHLRLLLCEDISCQPSPLLQESLCSVSCLHQWCFNLMTRAADTVWSGTWSLWFLNVYGYICSGKFNFSCVVIYSSIFSVLVIMNSASLHCILHPVNNSTKCGVDVFDLFCCLQNDWRNIGLVKNLFKKMFIHSFFKWTFWKHLQIKSHCTAVATLQCTVSSSVSCLPTF